MSGAWTWLKTHWAKVLGAVGTIAVAAFGLFGAMPAIRKLRGKRTVSPAAPRAPVIDEAMLSHGQAELDAGIDAIDAEGISDAHPDDLDSYVAGRLDRDAQR